MKFKDYFKSDLDRIGCTLSDLSRTSGLSSAVLSRYRSGERVPRRDGELLVQLCDGLNELEAERGVHSPGRDRLEFYRSVLSDDVLLLSSHFDALLQSLQMPMKDLSRALNYDASYLSRIRSGKRSPSDPDAFAQHVSKVVIENAKQEDIDTVRQLIQADEEEPLEAQLKRWLVQKEHQQTAEISSFLTKLDDFNLDQFVRGQSFEETAAVSAPLKPSSTKRYLGTDAMRTAELDFFAMSLCGTHCTRLFMCNDMPIAELSDNITYLKNWMSGVVACVKKGYRIQIIHDIERPFAEMMIGLEGWIPLYMTGEISPYYLPDPKGNVYRHCLYVSDNAVLAGECIGNDHDNGRQVLSTIASEIYYGSARAEDILKFAKPLMKIFRTETHGDFDELWKSEGDVIGTRTVMSSVPAVCTMTGDLLDRILDHTDLSEEEKNAVRDFRKSELSYVHHALRLGTITLRIPKLTKAEFKEHLPSLMLAQLFRGLNIPYTWDSYQKHLQLTQEFAETTPGFELILDDEIAFRNLSIYTRNDRLAAVLKCGGPEICFVMTHPKMVKAIRSFCSPVSE